MSEGPPDGTFPPISPPRPILPWEDPARSMVTAFFQTAGMFLTRPTEAFQSMPITSKLLRPIAYGLIFGCGGFVLGQIYQALLGNPFARWLPPEMQRQLASSASAIQVAILTILSPLLLLLGLTINAALVHLALLLLGASGGGFAATLRVMCYAATANVAQILPFCGGLIGVVWTLALQIVGLTIAHRTTTWQAVLAVLFPLALCCACALVAVLLFASAIASMLGMSG